MAAAPGAAAAAGPAAIEEYVLKLPGVDTRAVGSPDPLVALSQRAGPQGVTGEREKEGAPLAAVAGAVASPPGLILVAATLAAGALALRSRTRSQR